MTDKQIIIDGVDVGECIYYQYNMCTATKDNYGDCSFYCKDYDMNDCYYKQLKRKEQECEELRKDIERWKSNFNGKVSAIEELLQQNVEKAENVLQTFTYENSAKKLYQLIIK